MMKVKMMSGDEVARLIIYGITPEDAGAYSISLSNVFGLATDVINVNVVGERQTDTYMETHTDTKCPI